MKIELIKTLKNEYLTHNERHTLISNPPPPCTKLKIWLSLCEMRIKAAKFSSSFNLL